MKSIVVFVFIFCFSVGALLAQQINQKDANGDCVKDSGKSTTLDSQQLRYQGSFVDDKEVGTFSFYCETCGEQPFCVKEFSPNAPTQVRYYTKNGDLVSKGAMSGKQRNWFVAYFS